MKSKFFIAGLIIALIILSGWKLSSCASEKKFKTFDEQKAYAAEQYKRIFDVLNDVSVLLEGNAARDANDPAWKKRQENIKLEIKKSLEAHIALKETYPEEFNNDVDSLKRLADSYFYLKDYNNALPAYEKELETFQRKYFNKEYKEKEKLSPERAQIEEYKYMVRVYGDIASCYTWRKEYDKTIASLEKSINLMDDLKYLNMREKYDIFGDTFIGLGAIYKFPLKNYDKAMEIYGRMIEAFPFAFAISGAEILIGDTYLAKGDIEKAKKIYTDVIKKYKYSKDKGVYNFAEEQLRDIEKGEVRTTDGFSYKIKDGKVTVERI